MEIKQFPKSLGLIIEAGDEELFRLRIGIDNHTKESFLWNHPIEQSQKNFMNCNFIKLVLPRLLAIFTDRIHVSILGKNNIVYHECFIKVYILT